MSREFIAQKLKSLREASGLTADEVGQQIGKKGKTVNAWENNRGQPDADTLLQLSSIYHVDNLLAEFNENQFLPSMTLSNKDKEHMRKYKELDTHGQKLVDSVLNIEYERCTEAESSN